MSVSIMIKLRGDSAIESPLNLIISFIILEKNRDPVGYECK